MVAARFWLATVLACSSGFLCADQVVVAVPLSVQPYFLPFSGSGLSYDTIRAAFASRGLSVRPLYVSSRQIGKLVTGDSRADCIPLISPSSDHEGWSNTDSIHLFHDFAITRPETPLYDLDDFKDKRVLAYSGAFSYLGNAFRSAVRDNPHYREINNHRAQVRLLLQGSVEVIIADHLLVSWYLSHLRKEDTVKTDLVFHDFFEPVAHEFICRSPELAAEFNAGLAKILEEGILSEILAKYAGTNVDSMDKKGTPPNGPNFSSPATKIQ